jgi:hypothetical protein
MRTFKETLCILGIQEALHFENMLFTRILKPIESCSKQMFESRFHTSQEATHILKKLDSVLQDDDIVLPPLFIQASENLRLVFSRSITLHSLSDGPIIPVASGEIPSREELIELYSIQSETFINSLNASKMLI